jgi:flagellar biosynthesis protein
MSGGARQAVALAYEPGGAPRVVAKGDGALGDRILEAAEQAGVPIERNAELAAALAAVELDAEIPVELFKAVAIVIGQVLRPRP